ncbi:Fidgetin [Manis pentadactyla]|nr:Fidgetin [Manis pentadactyla]
MKNSWTTPFSLGEPKPKKDDCYTYELCSHTIWGTILRREEWLEQRPKVWPPSCHVYGRKVESKEWWSEGESGQLLPLGVVPDNGKERSEVLFGEDSEQIGIGKKWSESLWNDNVQGSHDHRKLWRAQMGKREQERNKTKYCIKSERFKKKYLQPSEFSGLNNKKLVS